MSRTPLTGVVIAVVMAALASAGKRSVARLRAGSARAARLWGASDALLETMHIPLFSNCTVRRERGVAAARAQLGVAAFAAAWAEGRSQPCGDVVADVLRERSGESD